MTDALIWVGCADPTPLGPIWVAVSPGGLAAVEIQARPDAFLEKLSTRHQARVRMDTERTREAASQIGAYLEGRRKDFDLAIDWSRMPAFQRRALAAVAAVPYGEVTTYGRLAAHIGRPKAVRAVGRANATNPVPLVVPCHRVIGSDGSLRGYGGPGGIQTKAWLLALERSGP